MAAKPTKVIVDCSTGEQTIVELTAQEIAQLEADAAAFAEAQEAKKITEELTLSAKVNARAKLAELGLTVEEIAALTGV